MGSRFEGTARFQVLRQLGVGGFGAVYEVLDRDRNTRVALKQLTLIDPASLFRFKREFRIFADLRHEHLVALHELFSEGDEWFFTMELVEGVDWLAYIRGTDAETLPTLRANVIPSAEPASANDEEAPARLSTQTHAHGFHEQRLRASLIHVVRGLRALHATGSCHRDIKPSNIRVSTEGRSVVLDFGIASSDTAGSTFTDVNAVLGTPAYMAPEQAVSSAVTPAADWYALGVMLYEALTGELPFKGSALQILGSKQFQMPAAPSQRDPTLPADLDQLCVDLLQSLPERRPDGDQILARLGASPEDAPPAPSLRTSSGTGAFVGREDLLDALGSAYNTSRAGRLNVVFVHGTSGMGKSTLVHTFMTRAEGTPVVLEGRCLQRESVPYKAFDPVIDVLSKHLLALPPADAAALMPRDAAALSRIFPVLDRVPAFAASPRKVAELRDPVVLRSRAFVALRELFGRMTDRKPLVVFLDDLQWGDADSAWLLVELIAPPDPPPVLYVLSYRTDEAAASVFLTTLHSRLAVVGLGGDQRTLDVGTLSPEQALSLARTLLKSGRDTLAQAIAKESLGSPFFLGELVQYAQTESGRRSSGHVRLDEVVHHRVELLPDTAQIVLQLVSLAGHGVDRRVVRHAAGISEEALAPAIGVLRVGKLLKLAGPRGVLLEPFHDRIREVVVEAIAPDQRASLHRSLALAFNAFDEADPETLLVHFRAAGMIDQARQYARLAAERSAQALAFDRAAEIWGDALALDGWDEAERCAMSLAQANALVRAGRGAMAAPIFLRLAATQEPGMAMELQRQAGEQLLFAGQIARGTEVMELFLRRVGVRLPTSVAWMLLSIVAMRGWIALQRWDRALPAEPVIDERDRLRIDVLIAFAKAYSVIEALTVAYFVERLVIAALRSRSPSRTAEAMVAHAGMLGTTGSLSLEEVIRATDRAAELLANNPRQADIRMLGHVVVGSTATILGRSREGLKRLDEVIDPQRRVGYIAQVDIDSAMIMSAKCCYDLGEYRQLEARMPPYLHDALNRGDLVLSTSLRVAEASIRWIVSDRCTEGRVDVEEALSQWGRTTIDTQRWWGLWSLGTFDLYEGKVDEAHTRMVGLIDAIRWSRLRINSTLWAMTHLLGVRSSVARLAHAPDDPVHRKDATRRLRVGRRLVAPFQRPMLLLLDAGFECLVGRRDASLQQLDACIASAAAADQLNYAAFAKVCRGGLMGNAAGDALRAEGLDWLRGQGVVRPGRFVQTFAPGFSPTND